MKRTHAGGWATMPTGSLARLTLLARLVLLAGCMPMALHTRAAEESVAIPALPEASAERDKVRRLFDEAEACANRYRCAALDRLQDRAELADDGVVLQVAFDIMCDPKVSTFERRFRNAFVAARAWAAARTRGGKQLSIDDERLLRMQVMRLLARTDNAIPGHAFVEYLSDARDILRREALDLTRGNDEVHSAIRGLQELEHDLTTVRDWLNAHSEREMVAGALLLDILDHSKLRAEGEVEMLVDFARRTGTPAEAARIVANHAADHDDAAFVPVLNAFRHHLDASVREIAARRGAAHN